MREPAPSLAETIAETHRRLPSNTAAFNHFGTPSITVPCGFSRDGLPLGMQIVAAPFREEIAARVAHAYQQATDWHCRRPVVSEQWEWPGCGHRFRGLKFYLLSPDRQSFCQHKPRWKFRRWHFVSVLVSRMHATIACSVSWKELPGSW
jgi:hypothetical protein